MSKALVDCQYFGSIFYYHILNVSEEVLIDIGEHFKKSSFRNRCYIPGPNGVLLLTVPLKKGKNQRCSMNALEISYNHQWQSLHWKTLCACYRRSPFFEYYEDEIYQMIFKENLKLVDLNISILNWSINLLSLKTKIVFSEQYVENPRSKYVDWRLNLIPNKPFLEEVENYISPKYIQVFEEKTGFKKNMSILDLIFNEGPNAGSFLNN
jgi:hypothetical protein